MKEFVRDNDYMTKIFLDAFNRDVRQDVICEVTYGHGDHYKVYCPSTGTYLQFPRALRTRLHRKFLCDVVRCKRNDTTPFYRAYPRSIRDSNTGEVLA